MHMYSWVMCFVCDAEIKEPNASMMPFNAIANLMTSHCNMYAPNFFSSRGITCIVQKQLLVCDTQFIPVNLSLPHIETSLQSENLMTHSLSVF